jgi:hypothetical protein
LFAHVLPIAYAYTKPFVQPMPLWDYWYVLLLPLCAAVSIVYKAIKQPMRKVPREALMIFIWILVGFCTSAAALAGLVHVLERTR